MKDGVFESSDILIESPSGSVALGKGYIKTSFWFTFVFLRGLENSGGPVFVIIKT